MCWDIGRADTALEDTGPVGTGRRSDTGSADTVPADIAHQSGTARRQARRTEEWRPRQLPPDGKGAASWECLLEAFYTHFAPASRLDVALRRAVALGLESRSTGVVARSAGRLGGLGGLVHRSFPVQRRFRILRPICRMAGLTFVLLPLGVRRVIVGDVAVLGGKHKFGGCLLILGHHGRQRDHGEEQKISQYISHDGHYKR